MAIQRGETQLVCFGGAKAAESSKEGVNGAQTQHHTRGHTGQTSELDLTYVVLSVRLWAALCSWGRKSRAKQAAAVFLVPFPLKLKLV